MMLSYARKEMTNRENWIKSTENLRVQIKGFISQEAE